MTEEVEAKAVRIPTPLSPGEEQGYVANGSHSLEHQGVSDSSTGHSKEGALTALGPPTPLQPGLAGAGTLW